MSAWDVSDKTAPRFLDFLPVGGKMLERWAKCRAGTTWAINDPTDPQLVYEPGDETVAWRGWHDQVVVPGVVDDPVQPVLLSKWSPPVEVVAARPRGRGLRGP